MISWKISEIFRTGDFSPIKSSGGDPVLVREFRFPALGPNTEKVKERLPGPLGPGIEKACDESKKDERGRKEVGILTPS